MSPVKKDNKKSNTKKEEVKKPVAKKVSKPVEKKSKVTTSKKTVKTSKKEDVKKPVAKKVTKPVEKKSKPSSSKKAVKVSKKEEVKKPVTKKVEKQKKELEEFSWDSENDFSSEYSDKERKDLEKLYTESLNNIVEKQVIEAKVVGITNRDVVLNVGSKSDGIVSISEFRDNKDLKLGDVVNVYVEERENIKGELILSRKKAKLIESWDNIQKGLDNDEVIEGFVKRRTKGGLIVDIYGIETFLPGSQIDVKPIRDYDIYVNKPLDVKVIKINYSNDNVVVSHKVLIEKDLEAKKEKILEKLEIGQVLEGSVKNMTSFGVFVDLGGGIDGLLHITDISWGRVNHPQDILSLDEKIKVVVLDYNNKDKRISLGMKQLTEQPWNSLDEKLDVGSEVEGLIVNVADYGAFLELTPGVEGLIHVSEMSWSQHLRNPSDFMKVGDKMKAIILSIDRNEKKMSLGVKQLNQDPWTNNKLLKKYSVGSKHQGIVRNLTNFGLFLELEEGIDGLVHVSDLSHEKKIKHPSEFIKVGETLEVMVLEQDNQNKRLALSHKELLEKKDIKKDEKIDKNLKKKLKDKKSLEDKEDKKVEKKPDAKKDNKKEEKVEKKPEAKKDNKKEEKVEKKPDAKKDNKKEEKVEKKSKTKKDNKKEEKVEKKPETKKDNKKEEKVENKSTKKEDK